MPPVQDKRQLWAGAATRYAGLFIFLCLAVLGSGCSLHSGVPEPQGASASGKAISHTALSAVGANYKYGGTHPSMGFDCSGLVCWSYARHGVKMPRTAREQSSIGAEVSKSNLKAGDVVVFRISSGMHTGIYTSRGKFVHSPSSGKKVREESLNSEYWRNKFVAGRRVRQIY